MLRPAIFSFMLLISMLLQGQTLRMTFSASGAYDKVDSVQATNLRTTQNVTLPGNDTLYLSVNTGIGQVSGLEAQAAVFPNPCHGNATLVVHVQSAQTVSIVIYNLTGQMLTGTQVDVPGGSHAFPISLSKTGIYIIRLSTDIGTTSIKVVSTESDNGLNLIRYAGMTQGGQPPVVKSTTIYSLGYSIGDIVLYRCRGGIHTTIITDAPTASTIYDVAFVPCIDPDGKSYATVKIGNQVWMAENLAWLPAVSKSAKGSDSIRFYYVYNYEDSLVSAAKSTMNYQNFGVLYNWPAAMNTDGKKPFSPGPVRAVCPAGWLLPDDSDWKTLERALGMSPDESDTIYWRISGEVGRKLKSSVGWLKEGNGTNASGFTALPGGYRNIHGGFWSEGGYSLFWSASIIDSTSWYRSMSAVDSGVYRLSSYRSHGLSVRCVKE